MKRFVALLNVICSLTVSGQFQGVLNVNNIKAVIKETYHNDLDYFFPENSNTETVFLLKPMIMGIDSTNGSLKGIPHSLFTTYKTGPLTIDGMGQISSTVTTQFNKVWQVTRQQIQEFNEAYDNGSIANGAYTIPTDILTWPAHGPNGYASYLAPFFDRNMDGMYNPYHGDYPLIKGDKMLYYIFNDNTLPEYNPNFAKLEVHVKVWACNYPSLDSNPVNRATFWEFTFVNRSSITYLNTNLALFADSDIGNCFNDYFQTHVATKSLLFFNGDAYDEDGNGMMGYHEEPPLQSFSIVRLKHNQQDILDDTVMLRATFYVSNSSYSLNNLNVFYNYTNYINWDSTHQTFGNTNIKSRYFMPGFTDPNHLGTWGIDPGFIWNELTSGNQPGDRRGIMSSGPFTFRPGDMITATYMLLTTQLPNYNMENLISKHSNEYYLMKEQNLCGVYDDWMSLQQNMDIHSFSLAIFPNPTADVLYIQHLDTIETMAIYDMVGRCRLQSLYPIHAISVSDWESGVYVLEVWRKGEDIPVRIKWIKQ